MPEPWRSDRIQPTVTRFHIGWQSEKAGTAMCAVKAKSKRDKWTEEETRAAVERIVAEGGDDNLLVEVYGSTKAVWAARCRRFGVLTPNQRLARQKAQARAATEAKALALIQQGYSQAYTARLLSLSPNDVTRLVKKAGLPRRKRISAAEMPARDRLISASSKTNAELAAEFHCSRQNIKRIKHKQKLLSSGKGHVDD